MLKYISLLTVICPTLLAQALTPPQPRPAFTKIQVDSIVNAASGQPGFASGTWLSLYGVGLANHFTRAWQDYEFINGALPTAVDVFRVQIGGPPGVGAVYAYISYISANQMNILVPDFPYVGPGVSVEVYGELLGSGYTFITKTPYSPGMFTLTPKYPAAVHLDGTYIGPAGIVQGVPTTPAKPKEIVVLFGTGFGQTNPPTDYGYLITRPNRVAATVTATVGGQNAAVDSFLVQPGIYQFNVTLPDLANGDWPVTLSVGGVSTQSGMFVTIAK